MSGEWRRHVKHNKRSPPRARIIVFIPFVDKRLATPVFRVVEMF